MQRDKNSNRSRKWVLRNSLQNQGCIDYVNRLCNSYSIEKYRIDEFKDDEPALFVETRQGILILTIDLENIWVQSYRRNFKNSEEYCDVPAMHFESDTCWKKGIEWVAKQKRQGV